MNAAALQYKCPTQSTKWLVDLQQSSESIVQHSFVIISYIVKQFKTTT